MRDTEGALKWIVNLLEEKRAQFVVSGGFAAKIYGSKRRLVDFDIGLRTADLARVLPLVAKYAIRGPVHYSDKHWRVRMVTLRYGGQTMDLFGADKTMMYDSIAKKWVRFPFKPRDSVRKRVFGVTVPVIRRAELVLYKRALGRGVDLADVAQLRP